jgi:cell fate (sporulation/competence/biofilm development) regulator YlbF (YheA/YmcA/DUF963 family)
MDIYEAAKNLGILITESKEFLDVQRAQENIEKHEQDRLIYKKYKQYKADLSKLENTQQQLDQLEKEARQNINIRDLLTKEEKYNVMIDNIKAVLDHFVGESFSSKDKDTKGCASGCGKGSKGGCCKK